MNSDYFVETKRLNKVYTFDKINVFALGNVNLSIEELENA